MGFFVLIILTPASLKGLLLEVLRKTRDKVGMAGRYPLGLEGLGHIRNDVQQRKARVDEAFALAGLLSKGDGVISCPSLASLYPVAWRIICGWTLNSMPASLPARPTTLRTASAVSGALALADEDVGRVRVVPLQSAQDAQLGPTQGMNRRDAVLAHRDVKKALLRYRVDTEKLQKAMA